MTPLEFETGSKICDLGSIKLDWMDQKTLPVPESTSWDHGPIVTRHGADENGRYCIS